MCKKNKQYWQVLCLSENSYGIPACQAFYDTKEEADASLPGYIELWPDCDWWVEEGTEWITNKCRHCNSPEADEEFDFYGMSTGHWCRDCYENNYPYRKDAYFDPEYAGESLYGDDDY